MESNLSNTSTSVSFPQPNFLPGNIPTWLTLMEMWFDACQITDDKTRCTSILLSLPIELSHDLLSYSDDTQIKTSYQTLKQELLQKTGVSNWHRHQQIFQQETLGDRTPSQLLRDMLRLSTGLNIEPSLLREAFLRKLPKPIQFRLVNDLEVHDLHTLAKMADRLMEMLPPSTTDPQVARASMDQNSSTTDARLTRLEDTLERLTLQLSRLTCRSPPSRRKSRSPSDRPQSRSPSRRSRFRHSSDWCYFHRRFGSKAYKCTQPCTFQKNAHARE